VDTHALLITQFQLAAMERVNVPASQREDFFLYADEFPSYCTDSFASIVSGARAYGLGLTLANQHLTQIPGPVRDAIFGNAGSTVSFRVGYDDAEHLSREFGGAYRPDHFTDLANYEICVKLLSDGAYGKPLTGWSNPPMEMKYGNRDTIVRLSRERYATPRKVVEDRIKRWMSDGR